MTIKQIHRAGYDILALDKDKGMLITRNETRVERWYAEANRWWKCGNLGGLA